MVCFESLEVSQIPEEKLNQMVRESLNGLRKNKSFFESHLARYSVRKKAEKWIK
jgi:hypothetical protein